MQDDFLPIEMAVGVAGKGLHKREESKRKYLEDAEKTSTCLLDFWMQLEFE